MRRRCAELDFLALPTAGTIYTVADLEREPMRFNSNLGHYTNFVNFFGLCGLALPFGFRPDGLPFGITLIAHPYDDQALLAFGARWQRAVALPLGKTASMLPPPEADPMVAEDRVSIAVVGAHMSGLPLNRQLTELRRPAGKRDAGRRRIIGSTPCPAARRIGRAWCASPTAAAPSSSRSGACRRGSSARFRRAGSRRRSASARSRWKTARRVQGFLCESYATAGARDITSLRRLARLSEEPGLGRHDAGSAGLDDEAAVRRDRRLRIAHIGQGAERDVGLLRVERRPGRSRTRRSMPRGCAGSWRDSRARDPAAGPCEVIEPPTNSVATVADAAERSPA